MTPERWQQIDRLLDAALEVDPSNRADFLDQACADDRELRLELESLLAAHQKAGGFIEAPATPRAPFADNHTETIVGSHIGHYRVVDEIARGGMGRIYLAEDTKLGRRVAIKLLPAHLTEDRDRLRRFKQEARAASALNHPNILTIYDSGEVEGSHFIVTEFVEGRTLRQLMSAGKLELAEAVDIAIQVAGALATAHHAGIIHRDIKPDNVMVRPDGYVKVLDFGIAKLVERDQVVSPLSSETAPGLTVGTPRYMSPEQVRGQGVDARTDIFSLGIVLFEMVAGRAPFDGETTADLMVSILQSDPKSLSDCTEHAPAELERIVSRALQKDREQRYQTADEFGADLYKLAQRLELDVKPAGAIVAAGSRPRFRRRPRAASSAARIARGGKAAYVAAVLAAAGLVGALIALNGGPEPPSVFAEFSDDFDVFNPNRWNVPATGWVVESGRLQLDRAAVIGFPKNLNNRDFAATFHLKLTNAGGAAWAVRVKDAANYYLFYLSGPEGLYPPARFNTYIVRNGRFDPRDHVESVAAIVELRAQGEYQVEIIARDNVLEHRITPAETGKRITLGSFKDVGDVFPYGGIGFRTVGPEVFSVDELYVLTPGALSDE